MSRPDSASASGPWSMEWRVSVRHARGLVSVRLRSRCATRGVCTLLCATRGVSRVPRHARRLSRFEAPSKASRQRAGRVAPVSWCRVRVRQVRLLHVTADWARPGRRRRLREAVAALDKVRCGAVCVGRLSGRRRRILTQTTLFAATGGAPGSWPGGSASGGPASPRELAGEPGVIRAGARFGMRTREAQAGPAALRAQDSGDTCAPAPQRRRPVDGRASTQTRPRPPAAHVAGPRRRAAGVGVA